jgi:hypothetical protein
MALAEAGRELASGLDPLAMSCFCEGPTARGHVMAEGYNIATAASLKEKFGK